MQSSSFYIQKKVTYNNQFTVLLHVQTTANNILNSDREMK